MYRPLNDFLFFGMMDLVDCHSRGDMDPATKMWVDDTVDYWSGVARDVNEVNETVNQMNDAAKAELKAKRAKDGLPDPTWKDLLVFPAIVAVTAIVFVVSLVL